MTREEELKEVKELIKENYPDANCGMFFTRNLAGDEMETILKDNISHWIFVMDGRILNYLEQQMQKKRKLIRCMMV